jgi:serine O-acetyltransferase
MIRNDDSGMSVWKLIYSDYRRYRATGSTRPWRLIFFTQGLWASTIYRLSHWLYARVTLPGLRPVARCACQIARKIVEIVTGISLPPECEIGPGLYIGHFGTIIVAPKVRIGANCNLSQGVTLGFGGRGRRGGYPTIGDRVFIAVNAVVLGDIEVGDDAVIGAGAVIVRPVPPRAVMVGNPARIASLKGSFDFIQYDGMEDDPERCPNIEDRSADAHLLPL